MNISCQSQLIASLKKLIPDDSGLTLKNITKNNGTDRLGVSLVPASGARQCAPVVYLEPYLKRAAEGEETDALASEIAEALCMTAPEALSFRQLSDFTWARDRIVFRLISREKNKASLPKLAGRPFLDLFVSYAVMVLGRENDIFTAAVTEELPGLWGTSEEELYRLAEANTPRLLGDRMCGMEDFLKALVPDGVFTAPPEEGTENGAMYVLTNKAGHYGASAVLYTHALRLLAEKLREDLFLIPSSIHEMIVFTGEERAQGIAEIIPSVNRDTVSPEEVLSDRLYVYRRSGDTLSLWPDRV